MENIAQYVERDLKFHGGEGVVKVHRETESHKSWMRQERTSESKVFVFQNDTNTHSKISLDINLE